MLPRRGRQMGFMWRGVGICLLVLGEGMLPELCELVRRCDNG